MTAIGDVIQPRESIPDDVTGVTDNDGDFWEPGEDGWDLGGAADGGYTGKTSEWLARTFAPLTVTAVREPEPTLSERNHAAFIAAGCCGMVAVHMADCPQFDAAKLRAAVYKYAPEPQQADVSALIKMVLEYGDQRAMLAERRTSMAAAAAVRWDSTNAALLDRIAALVPQPSDPLVLSLPEVPEGAVALIGNATGRRYTRYLKTDSWCDGEGAILPFGILLVAEDGSVTVEMAPPREPRTELPCGHPIASSRFEDSEGDMVLITVAAAVSSGHAITTPLVWCAQGHGWLALTAEEYAELTEVFDNEPGGER